MVLIDNNGKIYSSIRSFCRHTGASKTSVIRHFKKHGFYDLNGLIVRKQSKLEKTEADSQILPKADVTIDDAILQEYETYKSVRNTDFSYHQITKSKHNKGERYAIALFSDAHIEEVVTLDSVVGLNEYNIDIANERITRYFANLVSCLQRDKAEILYFCCLGDIISGYLHPELEQSNSLTPPEAIVQAQSIIISGLKYIRDTMPELRIIFLGVYGNHSRTTKKIQHSNGFKLSYEWILYQNIKTIADTIALGIDFIIPKSEIAIICTPDNKRYIFAHGHQIKSTGNSTICGIYPALQRLALKWDKTFKQDKIFIGHFHSCTSIPSAVVNGSIIGYNAFAMSNAFPNEDPAQMYELYDTEIGLMLTRKIYCK